MTAAKTTEHDPKLAAKARSTMPRTADAADCRADDAAIRAIPGQMVDAWNRGSGEGFAASFADDANFIAFEGTHLEGRRQIVEFHQRIFETMVKGSRLEGEAKFVRFLGPDLAVMHAVARVALPGRADVSPSRDSMQLFVVSKTAGRWLVDAMLNARQLTIDRQFLLDDLESLPAPAQRKVHDFIRSLLSGRPDVESEELPGI
jgi:uncharacterized protein (TIGR02246 family)